MHTPKIAAVDLNDADPADAVNAFLHVLNRQRSLGLAPRSEHAMAEHLLRGEAKIVFYSNSGGIVSLVASDDLDHEDAFETVMFVLERRKARAIEKREAAALAKASGQ